MAALATQSAGSATSMAWTTTAVVTPARQDAQLCAPRPSLHRIHVLPFVARPSLVLADAARWVLEGLSRSARCDRSAALGSFTTAVAVVRWPVDVLAVATGISRIFLVSVAASLIHHGPLGQAGGASPQARAETRLVGVQPSAAGLGTSTPASYCAATSSV